MLDDRPLERSTVEQSFPTGSGRRQSDLTRLGLALVAILLIVAAVFVARRWMLPSDAPPAMRPPGTEQAQPKALGAPAAEVELPPLAEMDPFLRTLLGTLSARPELGRWLTIDDLTGHIASAIDQLARGISPAQDAKVIAPSTPFTAVTRNGRLFIAPASYSRYDGLAATVGSLDPSSVARIYTIIRPRLIEVSEFIGRGDSNLDGKVEAAIVLLLQTPSTGETVELVPGRGNTYAYADARLESLKPAQKHLLRMGPANARIVKDKIRAIASELGMAEATLPR
jgi:hypothetical protein